MSQNNNHSHNQSWTEVIRPESSLLDLQLNQVWKYRDLLFLLVKRDFVATYKQTILGPLWFFIQPVLTTIMFVIFFGRIAKLSTDGVPMIVFYLSGVVMWNYFSECLSKTGTVFKDNATLFGKVYFPRLIMPLSIVISNLVRFGVQFSLFLAIWLYYWLQPQSSIKPNTYIVLLPVLVVVMAALSLGFGLIVSAMTNKYKDLIFLLTFIIQLAMYATPVIYPLSSVGEDYKIFMLMNPMTAVIETFRYSFLGSGTFQSIWLGYSFGFSIVILFLGVLVFNKVEKTFMDTV
ncbi:MAG TPA: ABC transporter permease [Flavipsychrobacter sp.]|nr:ABC transporter permease [Flavipsychrobacter sp.]